MTEPKSQANTRFITWMVVALAVIIADQVTKWAIIEWVALYEKIPLNSFINLTHQRNTGAAFSFLADAGGWQRWFFVLLSAGVSCVFAVWLWRIRRRQGKGAPAFFPGRCAPEQAEQKKSYQWHHDGTGRRQQALQGQPRPAVFSGVTGLMESVDDAS